MPKGIGKTAGIVEGETSTQEVKKGVAHSGVIGAIKESEMCRSHEDTEGGWRGGRDKRFNERRKNDHKCVNSCMEEEQNRKGNQKKM